MTKLRPGIDELGYLEAHLALAAIGFAPLTRMKLKNTHVNTIYVRGNQVANLIGDNDGPMESVELLAANHVHFVRLESGEVIASA